MKQVLTNHSLVRFLELTSTGVIWGITDVTRVGFDPQSRGCGADMISIAPFNILHSKMYENVLHNFNASKTVCAFITKFITTLSSLLMKRRLPSSVRIIRLSWQYHFSEVVEAAWKVFLNICYILIYFGKPYLLL